MGTAGGLPSDRPILVGILLKRVLYEPTTILMAASAAFSVIGGIAQGSSQARQGESEAAYLRQQEEQERIALARDVADYDKETTRALARTRAVVAAQGGDTTTGDALELFSYQAGVLGENRQRLINDSDARIRSLQQRQTSAIEAGKSAQWASIFSGFGKGLSTGVSLFSGPKVPTIGAGRSADPTRRA